MYYDPRGNYPGSITASIGGTVCVFLAGVAIIAAAGMVADLINDIAQNPPKSNSSSKKDEGVVAPETPKVEDEEDVQDEPEYETEDSKLPTTGEPNSTVHLRDSKGIKQTRHYGPDGKVDYDIDHRHGGTKHKFPHKHKWTWKDNVPRRGGQIDLF